MAGSLTIPLVPVMWQRNAMHVLRAIYLFVLAGLAACRGAVPVSSGVGVGAGSGSATGWPPSACTDDACLAARCEHGEVASCTPAARRLERSLLRADRERAVRLREIGCAKDSNEDCGALANALAAGAYVRRDDARAAALRDKLCVRQVIDSCFHLALQHVSGLGVFQDNARAMQLFTRSCAAGHADACRAAAQLHDARELYPRAFDLYLDGCRAGNATTCYLAHEIFVEGHVKADVPADVWAGLATRSSRACAAGDGQACATMADLADRGQGLAKDSAAAGAHRAKACELGAADACLSLGPADATERARLRTRACELGLPFACYLAGADTQDLVRRRELHVRGCDLGDVSACADAVRMFDAGEGGPVDLVRVAELRDRQCSMGNSQACMLMAEQSIARGDLAGARGYHGRACELHHRQGCRAYARAHGAACNGGDRSSCLELDRFLATLPPVQRDLVAWHCCRDRPGLDTSPAVQLAKFVAALRAGNLAAVRAFVHPRLGMAVRLRWWHDDDEYKDRTFTVRARSLSLRSLEGIADVDVDALDCPERFDAAGNATCVVPGGFPDSYKRRRALRATARFVAGSRW